MNAARVAVVGSANLDIVPRVDRRPAAGETVLGRAMIETPGGKGANQALSCARVAPTHFIGSIGRDSAGRRVETALREADVDVTHLTHIDTPTGRAYVTLTPDGENSIVVMGLANSHLSDEVVLGALEASRPTLILAQLEVPKVVTEAVLEWTRQHDVRLVFNPSPADPQILANAVHADPLIVNEHEAAQILQSDSADVGTLATELSKRFRSVVVTAGSRGAFVGVGGNVTRVQTSTVTAVADTTGAGDAFAGTLAAHLALGLELVDAAKLANAEAGRLVQLERTSR